MQRTLQRSYGAKRWRPLEEHRECERAGTPAMWFLQRDGGEKNHQGEAKPWRWGSEHGQFINSFLLLHCFLIRLLTHHCRCSMHRPNFQPISLFPKTAPLGSWTPDPLSWEHHTFRGSGRSTASFSTYSWIGGWKKKVLVCHRRPSCFCAAALTFLVEQRSRVTHTARWYVPPNTHQLLNPNIQLFLKELKRLTSSVPQKELLYPPGVSSNGMRCLKGWWVPHQEKFQKETKWLFLRDFRKDIPSLGGISSH